MEVDADILEDDFLFFSLLYSSITLLFAMAVLSKFLTNEFRFGFRSFLSLGILFVGEPFCHFMVRGTFGVVIFGLGCLFIYSILPASHLTASNKAVLITGCDSGFGHALAKKLDSIGMTVFAGCLFKDGPGAIGLSNSCSDRLKVLQMDVTDDKQIQESLSIVSSSVGNEGLWGLVNNAGISYLSEIEMTPEKVWRNIMEVNLFGMIRVTKAFLPLVRKAKGRIVNMSSVTGTMHLEVLGAYAVSKSAIEAYSDVLRIEMKKWGVHVAIVQPTGYNTAAVTGLTSQEKKEYVWKHIDDLTKDTYGKEYFDKIYEIFNSQVPKFPKDLTPVLRVIRAGLLSKRPRARYQVGLGAGMVLNLFPILPMCLADKLVILFGSGASDVMPSALR